MGAIKDRLRSVGRGSVRFEPDGAAALANRVQGRGSVSLPI